MSDLFTRNRLIGLTIAALIFAKWLIDLPSRFLIPLSY